MAPLPAPALAGRADPFPVAQRTGRILARRAFLGDSVTRLASHLPNPLLSLMGRVVITHRTRQAWATVKACCSKGFQLFRARFET